MHGPWRTHMCGSRPTQTGLLKKKIKSISASVLRRMSLLRWFFAILADASSVRKWPTQKFGS